MPDVATFPAADRFAAMIEALCEVVAAGLTRLPGPLVIRIWDRLNRILTRFAAIAARPIQRRGLRAHPQVRPQPHPVTEAGPARTTKSRRLPTGYAWLIRRLPAAAPFAADLQRLFTDPQFTALLQATPSMGRLLRPLCRMLGVHPPPELQPRRRAPHPPAAIAAEPTAPPSQTTAAPPPQAHRAATEPASEPPSDSAGPGSERP